MITKYLNEHEQLLHKISEGEIYPKCACCGYFIKDESSRKDGKKDLCENCFRTVFGSFSTANVDEALRQNKLFQIRETGKLNI